MKPVIDSIMCGRENFWIFRTVDRFFVSIQKTGKLEKRRDRIRGIRGGSGYAN
jgi:hypothetical protein